MKQTIDEIAALAKTNDDYFAVLVDKINPYIIKQASFAGSEMDELQQLITIGIWEVLQCYDVDRPFLPLMTTKTSRVIWRYRQGMLRECGNCEYLDDLELKNDAADYGAYQALESILGENASIVWERYGRGIPPRELAKTSELSAREISFLCCRGLDKLQNNIQYMQYLMGI